MPRGPRREGGGALLELHSLLNMRCPVKPSPRRPKRERRIRDRPGVMMTSVTWAFDSRSARSADHELGGRAPRRSPHKACRTVLARRDARVTNLSAVPRPLASARSRTPRAQPPGSPGRASRRGALAEHRRGAAHEGPAHPRLSIAASSAMPGAAHASRDRSDACAEPRPSRLGGHDHALACRAPGHRRAARPHMSVPK